LQKIYLKNKSKNFSSYLQTFVYKTGYRLDILLFRLGFFKSVFSSKYAIQNNIIFLNKTKVNFSLNLVKGDIIFVSNLKNLFFQSKLKESVVFFSFVELDFYTNKIIIVKDLQELNVKDFFLLTRDLYNILDLRDRLLN
jgi:ribosomal protein S4